MTRPLQHDDFQGPTDRYTVWPIIYNNNIRFSLHQAYTRRNLIKGSIPHTALWHFVFMANLLLTAANIEIANVMSETTQLYNFLLPSKLESLIIRQGIRRKLLMIMIWRTSLVN